MRFFFSIFALLIPLTAAAYLSGPAVSGGGGGGSPGGSNTQVQFNSSGSFGGSSGLTWASSLLTATNLAMPYSTGSSVGVFKMGSDVWMHAYKASGTNGANTFLGYNAGSFALSGTGIQASYNTGVGPGALGSLTTGNYNSAFGQQAGYNVTTGSDNSIFGAGAGSQITTGLGNTLFGYNSGETIVGASNNTCYGYGSCALDTASDNTMFGFRTGKLVTSGTMVTLFGEYAGYSGDSADHSTMFGAYAGYNNISGTGNTFFGWQAGYNATGSDNIYLGHSSATGSTGLTTGSGNIWIGNDLTTVLAGSVSNTLDIGHALFCSSISSGATLATSPLCGIGVGAPAYTWDVAGTGHFSGALTVGGNLTTNLTAASVPYIGASGLVTQDNANFFYNDATGLLTLSNGNGANTAGLKISDAGGNQLDIYDPGTSRNWVIGAQSNNFFIEQGASEPLDINSGGFISFSLSGSAPKYPMHEAWTDNSTSIPTDLVPNNGSHNLAVFTIQNYGTTANNWSGVAFAGNANGNNSATAVDAGMFGVHEVHTAGSEAGHLEFYTEKSGAGLVLAAKMDNSGNFSAAGSVNSAAPQTTLTGSAGTAICSEPQQGASLKKVVCYLNGYTDTGTQTFTYPTAFSHTPYVYGLTAGVSGASATTTTVTFTVTTLSGFVFMEGY